MGLATPGWHPPAAASETVAVIIPAYNAEQTIGDTLLSVRAQSWTALDIVVVDDGSTDATVAIARRHAAADHRVQVIAQPNAGVAHARNRGIAATASRYIAPVDADDLWSRDKIELQMAAVARHGGEPGLVYTWFCVIDEDNRITRRESRGRSEGNVLAELCRFNFVGTGSNALMLRSAVEAAGCYDSSLRRRGAEGSEDYRLYLAIAEHHEFVAVRDYLTGYRELPGNMSSNAARMVRSRDICANDLVVRHPELRPAADEGHIRFMRFMMARSLREGDAGQAARLLGRMFRADPRVAALSFAELVRQRWHRRRHSADLKKERPLFPIGNPDTDGPMPALSPQGPVV
ncbi:glycosyltransferase family 2 protein [Sphingomonas ginkgonis]|uniref:Glycosyltransferase family 2 protein n=1 Tax=Sphingomonas ginkgonis TaxID=2315330 RepID=A0A3R9X8N3_9SPHN|nr:glycosyltransferase family 2 protein [Sphingomonas ginkgonis]RST31394.1 glycosyltransferase family 2 protein [Sphingomonas ginkgonis]